MLTHTRRVGHEARDSHPGVWEHKMHVDGRRRHGGATKELNNRTRRSRPARDREAASVGTRCGSGAVGTSRHDHPVSHVPLLAEVARLARRGHRPPRPGRSSAYRCQAQSSFKLDEPHQPRRHLQVLGAKRGAATRFHSNATDSRGVVARSGVTSTREVVANVKRGVGYHCSKLWPA